MKRILLCILTNILLFSCDNQEQIHPIIIDPVTPIHLGTETLTTGTYLGFTIGDSPQTTYTKTQALITSKGLNNLSITHSIYTDLPLVKNTLSLYTSIFLDEEKGTDSGVQIYFENNTVKSIYLNSGKKLNRWPNSFPQVSIQLGESVDNLYSKLERIAANSVYRKKFERISLFFKDINKVYDSNMGMSPQWYFGYSYDINKTERVQLNFQDQKLVSIHVERYQAR
ncbi:hypothetical protein [Xanthocytophaga agilis]|uniref:Lipoprotein n=1 Tax=Xanthocytophaga agilis TaxID=3048010 RepID=A0AAE3R2E7_9BACT|nr:hypothetical protein [Xanthocytophaga agilis]MDJ1500367.1 hypothetical protein [Xanthocytophaga agilis]